MLSQISQHLRDKFKVFSLSDNIILNNKVIPISEENYQELQPSEPKPVTFIDGGQAELISGGNLNLSLIRVCALTMEGTKKISQTLYEFYLLTTARYQEGDLIYEGKVFPLKGTPLITDLTISSTDATLRIGQERAPISKVASLARRFAELSLAGKQESLVILDGTLQPTFKDEEQYLAKLPPTVSALAKTCQLFTTHGNNPAVLLQRFSPHADCWSYTVEDKTHFVKLHQKAKHVFRFEGNKEVLSSLIPLSSDPVFLGYPYGLILVDKLVRISHEEKNSLRMQILLREENRELQEYLNTVNAHEILDSLG